MGIDKLIIDYLHEMGCAEINPVWNNSDREFIVGYHWECGTEGVLNEVRGVLENYIQMERLKLTLSEKHPDYPTTKMIIYLNEYKK